MARIIIEIPDEILALRHDIEQYIGQRILPPLMQMVEDVKKREILEAQKTKIKRELNAIRKNITITLEDKPTPEPNTTFPKEYVPPDEGNNDVKISKPTK